MKTNASKCMLSVAVLLFCAGLVFNLSSDAKEPKKLAILPFTMNADRDLSFLQEGITDMLASRLAWKGELDVLEKGRVKEAVSGSKGPLSKESALAIGKSLQADYVILGSLTVFGDSVSLDSKILDVAKGEELITAFNQAKGMDAVIPTVTQFAQDINEKIMGRVVAAPAPQAGRPEGPKGPGGLLAAEGQAFEGKGVSHTQGIRAEVISLDVGDVDGDGRNELVYVSVDTVFVYKWAEKGFAQFRAIKEKWTTGMVYVSVADLDGNGRAEIYVSNLGDLDVQSFVLEWDGANFRKIAEGQRWFLRVTDMPGKGKVLLGQKRETGASFVGPVQILKREGNNFVSAGEVPLHRFGNIFNFAFADFKGTGRVDTVLLDWADYLRLYEPGIDEQVWRSEDQFGGTYTFMKLQNPQQYTTDYEFLPSPILITDVDEDGEKEVMVCKNNSPIARILGKMQFYSGGSLHFMTRDATGLSTKWTTRRLGGAIVGYRIADVDNDNLPELVIATVVREERMLGNPRSRIIVYDLK
ncbi:MAG: FG-GAP-like repeat-containing protein [Thermodesulfobacteriota bacterium]